MEATGEDEGCEDNIEDSSFCLPEDALSGSLSITDEIMELLNQRGLRAEPINGESKASDLDQAKPEHKDQVRTPSISIHYLHISYCNISISSINPEVGSKQPN